MSLYRDRAKCPSGHRFAIYRRETTAGRVVSTFCQLCGRMYKIKAGPIPAKKG